MTEQTLETEFMETILSGEQIRHAFKAAITDFFKDGTPQCVVAHFCPNEGLQIIKVDDGSDLFNDFLQRHDEHLERGNNESSTQN